MTSKKRIFVYEGERDPGLLSKMTSFMEECLCDEETISQHGLFLQSRFIIIPFYNFLHGVTFKREMSKCLGLFYACSITKRSIVF